MSELADLLIEAFEQEAGRPAQQALGGGIEAGAYWSFDPSVEVVLARADKTPADVPVDPPVAPVAPAALYEFAHGWSRRHHRLVHEGGYRVGPDGGGLRFLRPDGRVIPAAPRQRGGQPARVGALNRRRGLHIDDETAIPLSGGERMDYGMAVDGLLTADDLLDWPPRAGPEHS